MRRYWNRKERLKRSAGQYKEAAKYLVGGVNSPVRAFKAVGGEPIFIKKGAGSKIYDIDGNRYIDYVMSWGALMLGHAEASVIKALKSAADSGTSFGAPTQKETELAKIIHKAMPSIEKLRLVSSGTEAVMSAIRLSRGFTGKDKIIKFAGSYHGHYDGLLVKAGSGAATFGIPDSLGVPQSLSRDTIVCSYNDIDRVSAVIRQKHKEIACLIVEPVCANMGVVLPENNFLSDLREITSKYKVMLIFDEVITGFRLAFGGAQEVYGIKPDLTCLGKIIGAGLPIAAFGGKQEIMERLSPLGGVYQAGTLSGNPAAVSAGIAALTVLAKSDYLALNRRTGQMCEELDSILKAAGKRFCINRAGSMFTLFFSEKKVRDFDSAKTSDTKKYASYFWSMVESGVYLAPSQFEANFLSFAHKDNDIKRTLSAAAMTFKDFNF